MFLPPIFQRLVAFTFCVAAWLLPGTAAGAEWSAKPSVTVGMLENDNLLLTSMPHKRVTGLILTPEVDLSAQQENLGATGSIKLRDRHYWGQSGLNTTDRLYNLSSFYNAERSAWQIGGGYAKESVTASTTFSPDIGLTETQIQRTTRTINPSWTWSATENTQLQLSYQSSNVSYENGLSQGIFNYLSRDPAVAVQYQWTPNDRLTVQIDSAYFKVPQSGVSQLGQTAYASVNGNTVTLLPSPLQLSNNSTTNSGLLGLSHSFSETLSGNVNIGVRRTVSNSLIETCVASTAPVITQVNGQLVGTATCTQTADATQTEKDTGYLYGVGLDKQFELTHATLSLNRQISPSGSGTLVQVDSGALSLNRQFSKRLAFGLTVADYRIRALTSSESATTDRDYFQTGPTATWHWTEKLSVVGGYSYFRQKFIGSNVASHSNSVFLNFMYAWTGYSISR